MPGMPLYFHVDGCVLLQMAKVKVYIMSRDRRIDTFDTDDTHTGTELYNLLHQIFGDGALWDPKGKPVSSYVMRNMEAGVYKFNLSTAGTRPEVPKNLPALQILSVVWLHVYSFDWYIHQCCAGCRHDVVRDAPSFIWRCRAAATDLNLQQLPAPAPSASRFDPC